MESQHKMIRTIGTVFSLLSQRERVRGAAVVAILILASLAEVLAIASVLPFMTALTATEELERNVVFQSILRAVNLDQTAGLTALTGLIALTAIFVAAILRTFSIYTINIFSQNLRMSIGNRSLAKLLDQPYSFYSEMHSAALAKKVLYDVDQLTNLFLVPFSRVVAQVFVATAIATLLFVVNPLLTIVVALVIGSMYFVAHIVTSRLVSRLSYEASHASSARFKIASEAFGGIKELKVFGAANWFKDAFVHPSQIVTRNQGINATLSEAPRYVIETVTIGAIVLAVVLIDSGGESTGQTLSAALPTIGLMIFAGYRLLPAAQLIFQGLNAIKFSHPFVESIHDVYQLVGKETDSTESEEKLRLQTSLTLENVSFSHQRKGGGVSGVSMTISQGSFVGIAGATGSGKTTLIDLILGLHLPSSGAIYVDGVKLEGSHLCRWRRSLALVPQRIQLLDTTVAQNIAFGCSAEALDMRLVQNCADLAQIGDEIAQLPDGFDTVVGENGRNFSGGQQQRLGIARALYRCPSVLVLDEATSALDNRTEHLVLDAIANLRPKITVIAIAHRVEFLKACDVVFLMRDGELIGRGRYDELIDNNAEFRNLIMSTLD